MKKTFRLSALLLMLIIAVTMLGGCSSDSTDYIATAKAHAPFVDFPDITYGDVMDKYLDDPVWESDTTNGDHFAKVSGKIKGMDEDFGLYIYIKVNSNSSAQISMDTITFQGESKNSEDIISQFMYAFFDAYNQGLDDLSQYNI